MYVLTLHNDRATMSARTQIAHKHTHTHQLTHALASIPPCLLVPIVQLMCDWETSTCQRARRLSANTRRTCVQLDWNTGNCFRYIDSCNHVWHVWCSARGTIIRNTASPHRNSSVFYAADYHLVIMHRSWWNDVWGCHINKTCDCVVLIPNTDFTDYMQMISFSCKTYTQ